ncbi:MAG: metallophosphoesterase [Thermoproteota archaeon]|nr:MAG: metallophosphoesterase [Candidatus Korarchaeota archaeon]
MIHVRVARRTFLVASLAAAASTVLYARFHELNDVTVERLELTLGSRGAPLRVVHLSDLHLHGIGDREESAISAVEEASPDLIVVTGDHVDSPDGREALREFYSDLCGLGPVYAVLGNWDHWAAGRGGPTVDEIVQAIEGAGGRVLQNSGESVELGGGSIWVAGVDDPHTGRDDARSALEGRSGSEDQPILLLAHSPEIVNGLTGQERLVLCGHTHGGQVRLPLVGPLYVPSRLGRRYVSGLYRLGETLMYVNRGLGWSLAPLRLNCPPEVTVLDLHL